MNQVNVDCCYGISIFHSAVIAAAGDSAAGDTPLNCIGLKLQRKALERGGNEAETGTQTFTSSTTVTVGASYSTAKMRKQGQPPICSFGFQVKALAAEQDTKPLPNRGPESTQFPYFSHMSENFIAKASNACGNSARFWQTYSRTAADIVQISFLQRTVHVGQQHSIYMKKKVAKLLQAVADRFS